MEETMPTEKKSTLVVLGLPKEFGVLLLSVALILAVSPYLGGADFGIFKVPNLNTGATWVLRFLGPLLLISCCLAFLPLWRRSESRSAGPVDSDSKYHLQSIVDIVKEEAAVHGINIDGLQISDGLHINDIERMCINTWSSEKSAEEIHEILYAARAKAFTRKYAEPGEDEKLLDVSKITIPDLKPWETYFIGLLRDLKVDDLNQLDILYVGIGHGHADKPILSGLHVFRAADISEEALKNARKLYPQMQYSTNSAENLSDISNSAVDFYLSLRVYQSTLFDRRAALHEAYRVLRRGGLILLSIPIMYVRKDGQALQGLIPSGSTVPNMNYVCQLVEQLREYLRILNFRDISVDERSPFELYISARR